MSSVKNIAPVLFIIRSGWPINSKLLTKNAEDTRVLSTNPKQTISGSLH